MTSKHFEEMAAYIRVHKLGLGAERPLNAAFIRGMISMAVHMGNLFNKNFDEEVFMKACELPEEP